MHTLKLISRFYSGIFLANFLVTLSCIYLHWSFGEKAHYLVGIFFWYKLITLVTIFYTAVHYKKRELYYYQNLGISKQLLMVSTSVFDFMLWLVLYIIAYNLI
jgi:hypothetical protein